MEGLMRLGEIILLDFYNKKELYNTLIHEHHSKIRLLMT